MFYGLEKTQSQVSEILEKLVESDSLPSAMLFSGQECSSRMFAALKLSQVYDPLCNNTVVVSDRNFNRTITAAINLLKKAKNNAAKNFLKDSVSAFLMQFHGSLFDAQSSSGKKKFSDAAECSDLLKNLGALKESDVETFCNKLEKELSSLVTAKNSVISVSQVRAIRDWVNESSVEGARKFVIIEGLENALPSASNALLKTLEETPADAHFILISSNPGRIPATIRSRLRHIVFNPFSETEKNYVLTSLFVDPNKYSSIKSFIYDYCNLDFNFLSECANSLVHKKDYDINALVSKLEKNQTWDLYFECVIEELRKLYNEDTVSTERILYLVREIENAVSKAKVYNQTKRLTFDFIVYRTAEVLS